MQLKFLHGFGFAVAHTRGHALQSQSKQSYSWGIALWSLAMDFPDHQALCEQGQVKFAPGTAPICANNIDNRQHIEKSFAADCH